MKVKRIVDVVLALAGLVIFSPLLLTIMALIILDDGPLQTEARYHGYGAALCGP